MIEVKNLSKKYGDHFAVKDLSFTAEEGHILGFLGPNGAGKSTTMNMLTGYLAPSDGQITINGYDILKESEKAKKEIGYLPEIPPVYDYMTVKEYLNFAYELKKLDPKNKAEHLEEIMEKTKITSMQNRLIQNLSKGYKQRVGLAQAIMGYPAIIILDEPTVGLDPAQIIEIRQLIKELGEKHLVILSSHILTEISEVCDLVMIISKGSLVTACTLEELGERMNGETILSITARADANYLREVLEQFIDTLSFSVKASVSEQKEGFSLAELTYSDKEELRENLFFALAEKKIPLYEMKTETKSLEDVFLALTGADASDTPEDDPSADKKAKKKEKKKAEKNMENENTENENTENENTEEESC